MATHPPTSDLPPDDRFDPTASGVPGAVPPPSRPERVTADLPSIDLPGDRAKAGSRSLDLLQGLVGSRYRIVAVAGAGGMGQVVEAIDSVLQRRVALKFLREEGSRSLLDPAGRDRLIQEARSVAGLRHQGVCRVIEVAIDPPAGADAENWRPFLVMEWIQGVDCSRWSRTLSAQDRLSLFTKIVHAVAAMHGAGLLHLDLKPPNILVDPNGEPILVDFGLSRGRTAGGAAPIVGGTPGWSAPEQFSPDAHVGASADVFALGVLPYELLTGRRPFEGATAAELVERTQEGRPALPESIDPDVDPALQRICLVALDPDPQRRYSDAAMLAADLRRRAEGKAVLARPRQLLEEFAQQVELTVEAIDRWRRQGMATDDEARGLVQLLTRLKRPESPWILESRRLSLSQVSLYFGGWCLLLVLTIGAWRAERSLASIVPAFAWLVPLALVGAVAAVGMIIHRRGEWRIAFGFLLTTCLAIPAATWNSLRIGGWLAADEATSAAQLVPEPSVGLSNSQMLATGAAWLAASVAFRFLLPSAAFALLGSIAVFATWMPLWLRLFLAEGAGRIDGGHAALWSLVAGLGLVAAAWWRDAIDTRASSDALWKSRISDAGAIMSVGLVGVVASLSALAWFAPELAWGRPPAIPAGASRLPPPTIEARAAAFLMVGVLLLSLSVLFTRRGTPLRDRAARALRWIVPSFILLPIAWLEVENGWPGWKPWLAFLAAGSTLTIYASVWQQWRPFLLTGLVYFGEAVARSFRRIGEVWDDDTWVTLALFLLLAGMGLGLMVAAWRLAGRRVSWSRMISRTISSSWMASADRARADSPGPR